MMNTDNIKIIILGDEKVGKSSLFMKYTENQFLEEYNESKKIVYKTTNITIDSESFTIKLYDTPGNEKIHQLNSSIYLKTNCIIVIFDISNKTSFENAINKWIPDFFNSKLIQNNKNIPVALLGNFKDRSPERAVSEDEIKNKLKDIKKYTNFCMYEEISVRFDDVSTHLYKIISFVINNEVSNVDKALLNQTKNRINCKVLLLGDEKVGKTSIINRYIENKFSDDYVQTTSDDKKTKEIFYSSRKIKELFKDRENQIPNELYQENAIIQLDLWDNPGNEDMHNFNKNYYKHTTCCILVFDLCDRNTLEQVINWKTNFLENLKDISIPNEYDNNYYNIIDEIPFILVGNKSDILEREITDEEIQDFLEENQNYIKSYIEISTKENKGLNDVFENVCKFGFEFKINEMYSQNSQKVYEDINKIEDNYEEEAMNEENNNKDNNDDEYDIFGRSKEERMKEEKEEKERKEREKKEKEEKERKEKEEKERKEREEKERKEEEEKEEKERKEREEKERKEKEEKERKEKEEKEEKERREREEKERREKEEKERREKEEKERREKEKQEKIMDNLNVDNNIDSFSLIFELDKYFLNKEGNKTQFVLKENKNKVFIQIVHSLLKHYPCLNSIQIKSFENKANNNKINYYSKLTDMNLVDNSIITIKLD